MSAMDLFNLFGKVALVTGASRGLGAGMAVGLAEAGADIISIQRDGSNVKTKQSIEALGRTCEIWTCDLSDRKAVAELIPKITASQRIDILINSGGIVERNFAVDQTLDQYDNVIETNLTASWLLCQSIGRYWLKEGVKGRIVNISSIFGTLGTALQAPYSISKGGVELMTRALSNDWSSRGINVNAIAPGCFDTDMNADILAAADEEFKRTAGGRIPMARFGHPEDLKGPVIFLCSEASNYVTGETLTVDGGFLRQ